MPWQLANIADRAALVVDGRVHDLEKHGRGRFGPDPMAAVAAFEELGELAASLAGSDGDGAFDPAACGPPVPRPQKVFGIGLNYRSHAAEASMALPELPLVFTKFPSCVVGPVRRHRAQRRAGGLGGRGRRRDRAAGAAHRGSGRLVVHGGPHVGPGRLRPARPDGGEAAAVLDGQVLRHVRPDRSGAGLRRLVPRSGRRRHRLRRRRRAHAGRPHVGPDLLGAPAGRVPLFDLHARAGRPDLHRDARRRRHGARPLPRCRATS